MQVKAEPCTLSAHLKRRFLYLCGFLIICNHQVVSSSLTAGSTLKQRISSGIRFFIGLRND